MSREKKMQAKHISDVQVLRAYVMAKEQNLWPNEILVRDLGCHENVAYAAMERADKRGLIDYGVSLRAGFLTDAGVLLLARVAGCELRVREELAALRYEAAQEQVAKLYGQMTSLLEQLNAEVTP